MSASPANATKPQGSNKGAHGDDMPDVNNPSKYADIPEKDLLLATREDTKVDVLAVLIEFVGRRYAFKHKDHSPQANNAITKLRDHNRAT